MRIQRHGKRQSRLRYVVALSVAVVGSARTTAAVAHRTPVVADGGIWVEADLSERKLKIKQGDSTLEEYPVAIGKGSMPTPKGKYSIRKIVWNPDWIPPNSPWAKDKKPQPAGAKDNPMKLVKIFFREPDFYIHGTGDVESLGAAASHGCLRMDPDDAYRVARYLMEHGGQPRDENWFWRVLHSRSDTKTVYLDHPIPMVVAD